MNKYKVCVYSICKNEEQFVDRWIDSMNEADMIAVCDTGSSDGTVEKLKSRGAIVNSINLDPWRFDVTRNISLAFVPFDMDICVCTDLDEVLEAGWREKLENVWTPETTRLRYMYTWKFNEDGSRGATYWYEKIHGRRGYRWVHPIHEILQYYDEKPEIYAYAPAIHLNHFPDPTKSRSQYLSLLELSRNENPNDSSTVFWLGREYMFYGQYDKCIKTLKEHLSLSSAVWDQERCASMRYIARSYNTKRDLAEAKKWLYKAIAECPTVREPYVDMARLGYELKDWPLVYLMLEETLKIKDKPFSYLIEESSWDNTIYDLGSIACYWIGMFEKAYEFARIASSMNPHDERLEHNLKIIKEKITK
jgi:tetratricopeptide (TPR) repeat protein